MIYKDNSFYFESFNSVRELANTIDNRKDNGYFYGSSRIESNNMKDKSAKWRGTAQYADTYELIEKGDIANFKKMSNTVITAEFKTNVNATKKQLEKSVCGIFPNVPNSIIGVPKSMLTINRTYQPKKVLNVFVNRAVSSEIKSTEIIKCGLEIANFVVALEKKGIRVNLFIAWYAKYRNKKFGGVCKIKSAQSPLNKLSIVYPLVHPSFFRRNLFRWQETISFSFIKSDELYRTYGTPCMFDNQFKGKCSQITGKIDTLYLNMQHLISGRENIDKLFVNVTK